MMMRGEGEKRRESCTFLMNCLSICSVTVKSAMTPSFIGRMTVMRPAPCRAFPWLPCRPPGWSSWHSGRLQADGDDRRLVEDDALAAHVDQRVGGTEVDGEVVGEVFAEEAEHVLEIPGLIVPMEACGPDRGGRDAAVKGFMIPYNAFPT